MVTEKLLSRLEERGYKGRIVSIQHLRDLQEEIKGYHRQGLFDEELYREYIRELTSSLPDSLSGIRSMIVAAVPRPQVRVVFTWNGETLPLIIPPTYVAHREISKQVGDFLSGILNPEGHHVNQAVLPLKLLAVRSGLGTYGRNNICYVPEMGSFHQLVAFYSDLPCHDDNWKESQMMEDCQNCFACLRKCPTGAITSERFLLRAGRCITFHNEKPGSISFPAWINPSWHNCLIGCIHCQKVCPKNRNFLQRVEKGVEFSQEETSLLLQGVSLNQLPAATVAKFEQLDLGYDLDIFTRNLSVFLDGIGSQIGQ